MKKIIAVIGGGASGTMAAYQAALKGAKVYLFERNTNLARKVLISGKGRCNLTNIKNLDEFMENIPGNSNFLYSAFNTFSNKHLISFFEKLGVKTKIERGGRVFPCSDKSIDIVKALEKALLDANVIIKYNSRVEKLLIKNNKVFGLKFQKSSEEFYCDCIIVATGGLSYPSTGSTGDGYDLARKAGHTIIPLMPSLVPLTTKENWVKQLQGLTLKNVKAYLYIDDEIKSSEFGEMIFTHFGISGPIILTLSRSAVENLPGNVKISIDLKPALSEEQLDKRVLKDFKLYQKKLLKNSLDGLLPKKLISVFIDYCKLNPQKPVNQITKEDRYKIVKSLKDFKLTITGYNSKEAIVTRGGVSTKKIDPRTMQSKIIEGLFFAGEVIDVDGLTGGYNLQVAFSTGYLAGINAAL
mgnify:CR=1 FL=1|jgi:predicted Rossmann fold flavoprotein